MNSEQAKQTLDKIQSLFDSLQRGQSEPSAIERDLMLSYIKQLYEAFLHSAPLNNVKAEQLPAHREEAAAPVRRSYSPPRIIEIPDALRDMNAPEPVRRPPPQPQQPLKPKPQQPEPSKPAPQRPQPPQPQPTPPPKPDEQPVSTSRKAASLFEFKQAADLSEKLSERPVQDLTKALAINDRLLYMNELFRSDLNALNDNLAALNRFEDMDQARPLLLKLADRYDWTEGEREDIARDFIRLVRRRYI